MFPLKDKFKTIQPIRKMQIAFLDQWEHSCPIQKIFSSRFSFFFFGDGGGDSATETTSYQCSLELTLLNHRCTSKFSGFHVTQRQFPFHRTLLQYSVCQVSIFSKILPQKRILLIQRHFELIDNSETNSLFMK